MLEALCLAFGLACWDGDRPPPVAPPQAAVPAMAAPAPAAPSVTAPAPAPPSHFDAACAAQPPDNLKEVYWQAYQAEPLGATDCELAKQGKAECDVCWTTGDYSIQSPAGAIGVGQFLPPTAAELGINPHDPRESIFAQARYLKWCRDGWDPEFDGRTHRDVKSLGLGCYNWGRGAMYRSQRKHGWGGPYLEAKPFLPAETRGYVLKIEGW